MRCPVPSPVAVACGPAQNDTNVACTRQILPGRILAAPSWVLPGTLAENCAFLAGRVDEVGLLLLESEACLAYGPDDLPPDLALLPLRWHVHLPLDLPWNDPGRAARICAALLDKVRFLTAGSRAGPSVRAVLHPPVRDPADRGADARALAVFANALANGGHDPALLLLENIRGNDLSGLHGFVREAGCGVCLDTGHALAYEQDALWSDALLLEKAGILHLNAPGPAPAVGRHYPLTALDPAGRERCARLCRQAFARAVIMPELFGWQDILDSLGLIRSWLLPRE